MKSADQHRSEIRAIIETNRRQYVAQRIADLMTNPLEFKPSVRQVHTDALEAA